MATWVTSPLGPILMPQQARRCPAPTACVGRGTAKPPGTPCCWHWGHVPPLPETLTAGSMGPDIARLCSCFCSNSCSCSPTVPSSPPLPPHPPPPPLNRSSISPTALFDAQPHLPAGSGQALAQEGPAAFGAAVGRGLTFSSSAAFKSTCHFQTEVSGPPAPTWAGSLQKREPWKC